jgi:two-component system sensor histidine kinase PhoQ
MTLTVQHYKQFIDINSIHFRLLFSSIFSTLIFVLLTAWFIETTYRDAITQQIKQHLDLAIDPILRETEILNGEIVTPDAIGLSLFDSLSSNTFAIIYQNRTLVWISHSGRLVEPVPSTDNSTCCQLGEVYFSTTDLTHHSMELITLQKGVGWEVDNKTVVNFTVAIYQSSDQYHEIIQDFRTQLWGWLSTIIFVLFIALIIALRWAISPINHISNQINDIKSGKRNTLTGQFPVELQSTVTGLNELLEQEGILKERYRNSLSDLAHSIKTPLAGIKNMADQTNKNRVMLECINRIQQSIGHHLHRSTFIINKEMHSNIDVTKPLNRLISALEKVYIDKHIEVEINISNPVVLFKGDIADFLEVMGNILENAFKYCRNKVRITLSQHVYATDDKQPICQLSIEDNGPGISPEQRLVILTRGNRADTQKEGQGIGLAVVIDILTQYDGTIEISEGQWGGASFNIRL